MKLTKNAMKYARGFTLIELLVVIAIIGILSSIVLASLSSARSKAEDSTIEEQLSGMRSAAEIYSEGNGSLGYGTFAAGTCAVTAGTLFGDTGSGAGAITNAVISTNGLASGAGISGTSPGNGTYCKATASAWIMAAALPSTVSGGIPTSAWCADSTGKSERVGSGGVAVALGTWFLPTTATTTCP